jgi:hypothetical protein
MLAAIKTSAEDGRGLDALAASEAAIAHVVSACAGQAGPLRILMLIEDPGAANFAVGLQPILSQHGSVTVLASGAGAEQLERLNVATEAIMTPFEPLHLIEQWQPDMIIVGTSEERDAAAHTLVAACRDRGIPSLGLVDGPANIKRRFQGESNAPLAFAPDWIFVPNLELRAQLQETGFPKNRAIAVEHPHFAHLKIERVKLEKTGRKNLRKKLFPNLKVGQPIIVFLAERSDGLDSSDFLRCDAYTLQGRGGDDRRTNIVFEEVLDALNEIDPRPYVVLRLHPKNSAEEFMAYRGEIDRMSQDEPALEVVYAADLVVGMTTMLLTETALIGGQAISVVPRKSEQAWLLDTPRAQVPCIWDRQQIRNYLVKMRRYQ